MINTQQILWSATLIFALTVLGVLTYHLTPVLMPFVIAATLAYLTDPLVEYLSRKAKIPRTVAVIGVFIVVFVLLFLAFFLIIPTLQKECAVLIAQIPAMLDWLQEKWVPYLSTWGIELDLVSLKAQGLKHISQASQVAKWAWHTIFYSSSVVLHWIMNFLIILVAAFYLLRDWPQILQSMRSLIPGSIAPTVLRLVGRCDEVLSTFVRGQLSVMACLGLLYGVGLGLIGVNFFVLLGLFAGVLSVVPYLGSILGFGAAITVAYLQFPTWYPILGVCLVFGIGHLLEMMVLTPLFIGDKLGLHPVVVIFAVLAGGHLLGVMGVIIALPIAAIMVVFARELLNKFSDMPPLMITDKGGASGK